MKERHLGWNRPLSQRLDTSQNTWSFQGRRHWAWGFYCHCSWLNHLMLLKEGHVNKRLTHFKFREVKLSSTTSSWLSNKRPLSLSSSGESLQFDLLEFQMKIFFFFYSDCGYFALELHWVMMKVRKNSGFEAGTGRWWGGGPRGTSEYSSKTKDSLF